MATSLEAPPPRSPLPESTPASQPPGARRRRESAERRSYAFAELHAISNYSFLSGASHPEELVRRASQLGYEAIAITDECSLAGVVKAHQAAQELGIKLIVGAEFQVGIDGAADVADSSAADISGADISGADISGADVNGANNGKGAVQLVLLAPTRRAYGQLSTLVTRARRRSRKGAYHLRLEDLRNSVEDCLALWIPHRQAIAANMAIGRSIKDLLANLWIALELFLESDDLDKTAHVLALSNRLQLAVVASNGARMHVAERKPLHDVLTAVRCATPIADLGTRLDQNRERHLKPLPRLTTIYSAEMLAETMNLADRCTFRLSELSYEYPRELVPAGETPAEHLRRLVMDGARQRWPEAVPPQAAAILAKELEIVAELGYEYFFLTVHDIVRFARSRGILCQGRGSAANSAICFCLGITELDPSKLHLLFERFVSKERNESPDIDVDFEHARREEVIQYIYQRYGRERAALAATVITYRPRSAIRDVGKALGLRFDLLDHLAKSMAWWDNRKEMMQRFQQGGMNPNSRIVRQFDFLVREILGFPRHLSQHVGGFVISAGPLAQLVPVENAAMPDRTVIQWDKYDLEALGLLKVDVLGLGMLTAIRKSLALLGASPRMADIPPEDPATYAMLQRADSVGVFQVESRAQMSMLPRLKPRSFYDLVIEVAIVRPGPIQGDMVHPYLRRRAGKEAITYSNDAVRRVLERTLGIPIFQEQVIELAMVAAGFSGGEADQLRRAMAAWKKHGGLEPFEQKLISGMLERGHDREFAERIFNQIKGFGEYGFPESHAASFALLVYVSAWLKRHHPAAFYCGLLNSQPMGFYTPSQLLQDAVAHGIECRPPDVQKSTWDYTLETPRNKPQAAPPAGASWARTQPSLRVGLRQIKGMGEEAARRIELGQPYRDIDDLQARATLGDRELTFLARAGALKSLAGHRYQAHWDAAGVDRPAAIWQVAEARTPYRTAVKLPPPSAGQDLLADYRYVGLTLGPHPLALLRGEPEFKRCRTARQLAGCRHEQFIQVAGIVTCRQRPGSASGVVFLTLEDETGNSSIVVWNSVLTRFRQELLGSRLIAIKGIVEREETVVHVVAGEVRDLSHKLAELGRMEPAQDATADRRLWRAGADHVAADDARYASFRSRNFR